MQAVFIKKQSDFSKHGIRISEFVKICGEVLKHCLVNQIVWKETPPPTYKQTRLVQIGYKIFKIQNSGWGIREIMC